MQVGFKTGPTNFEEGKKIVLEEGATMCEVWFRVDKADEYSDMLAWLAKHNVRAGLHHWGLIDGTFKTNITSPDAHIRQETIKQIKETIDIGARIGCAYVNAHCGARATEKISFVEDAQELVGFESADEQLSKNLFFEATGKLFKYARQQEVLLTIETLPGLEKRSGYARYDTYDPVSTNYRTLLTMAKKGGYIANDITHTASQIFLETQDIQLVWQRLYAFTKEAVPYTRLLHVNTFPPPFNGTDSHHGILPEDFEIGGFPSREQVSSLLALFKGRDDVFAVPEPQDKMRKNFLALRELAA